MKVRRINNKSRCQPLMLTYMLCALLTALFTTPKTANASPGLISDYITNLKFSANRFVGQITKKAMEDANKGGSAVAENIAGNIGATKMFGRGGATRATTHTSIALNEEGKQIRTCTSEQTRIQSGMPNTNGCGINSTDSITTGALFSVLDPCCRGHDYSYSVCDAPKQPSDEAFGKCSLDLCQQMLGTRNAYEQTLRKFQWRNSNVQGINSVINVGLQVDLTGDMTEDLRRCRNLGDRMYQAVQAMGTRPYVKSQNEICGCAQKGTAQAVLGSMLKNHLNNLHSETLRSANGPVQLFIRYWATLMGFM